MKVWATLQWTAWERVLFSMLMVQSMPFLLMLLKALLISEETGMLSQKKECRSYLLTISPVILSSWDFVVDNGSFRMFRHVTWGCHCRCMDDSNECQPWGRQITMCTWLWTFSHRSVGYSYMLRSVSWKDTTARSLYILKIWQSTIQRKTRCQTLEKSLVFRSFWFMHQSGVIRR